MKIRPKILVRATLATATILMLGFAATPASSQCGMMGGGGHGHGGSTMRGSTRPSGSEKRLLRDIERVLANERGRLLLADALLNDPAFMVTFIQRLAEVPEWRARAAEQLGAVAPDDPENPEKLTTPGATVHACPMHPDVTSPTPGECTKCGMKLEPRRRGGN